LPDIELILQQFLRIFFPNYPNLTFELGYR